KERPATGTRVDEFLLERKKLSRGAIPNRSRCVPGKGVRALFKLMHVPFPVEHASNEGRRRESSNDFVLEEACRDRCAQANSSREPAALRNTSDGSRRCRLPRRIRLRTP